MTVIELLEGVSKPGAVYLHPEDWEQVSNGKFFFRTQNPVRVSKNVLPLSKIKNPLLFYSVTGSYFIVEKAIIEGEHQLSREQQEAWLKADLLPGLEESAQPEASSPAASQPPSASQPPADD